MRVLALLPLAFCGCLSTGTWTTARTLPQGSVQGFAALSAAGPHQPAPAPTLHAGVRYGLTGEIELGAHLWNQGARVETKVALRTDPESPLRLSFLGGLGTSATSASIDGCCATFDAGEVVLGVIGGWRLNDALELVVAPKLMPQARFAGPSGGLSLIQIHAGTSVGLAWRFWPSPPLVLLPEASLAVDALDAAPPIPLFATLFPTFEVGVALLLGGGQR